MRIIIILLVTAALTFAQDIKVVKLTGKVEVLKQSSDELMVVRSGDILSPKDMIVTGSNSSVQILTNSDNFTLKDNSALNLNAIKKYSMNELIMALAVEDVKSVPKRKNSEGTKNTAVYGSKNKTKTSSQDPSGIGIKRLNGARRLAENGYPESAIIFAKETFRKYPETKSLVLERLYVAGLFEKLSLKDEALAEYAYINGLELTSEQKKIVLQKLDLLSAK